MAMSATVPSVADALRDDGIRTTGARFDAAAAVRGERAEFPGVEGTVHIRKSGLPGAGDGLFTSRSVAEGETLYVEQLVWASDGGWHREDGTFVNLIGASHVWSLVYHLAREGEPAWWGTLALHKEFVAPELQLECNRRALDFVVRELGGARPLLMSQLMSLFGKALTNYLLAGFSLGDADFQLVACGRLYSKMNHARQANVQADVWFEGGALMLGCRAAQDMVADTELLIDYGTAAAERGLS